MKILVTGAAGQVGKEIIEIAAQTGIDVAGFDSAALDITSFAQVSAAIERESPDCVINAAAYTAVDRAESEAERAYAVNRDGVAHLAAACKKADIPLLHISTDYVFDGAKADAYTENDVPNPTSVYGASKLAGEQALIACWHKHIILRVSWVFGQHGNNFVKTMLRLGRERDELRVVRDQFGAPTSARAIARLLVAMATSPHLGGTQLGWGVRHMESNPGVTWCEFAKFIFEQAFELALINRKPAVHAITSAEFPTPVKRPANSKLATSRPWPADLPAKDEWQTELQHLLLLLK